MSAEANRALLHRYIEEVWDKSNPEAVDQFLAPHYQRHRTPSTPALTREGQKQLLTQFRTAFPDIRINIQEVIANENGIAFRSTLQGTHLGEFLGIPPTGREIQLWLLDLIHIEDGQFVEQWGGPDLLDLYQQLGVKIILA